MSEYSNVKVPKINIHRTPEEKVARRKKIEKMHISDEELADIEKDIRQGRIGYIDENGQPQLYPR